ncbi:CHASE2 domain-containing protein [Sodalinema gerasimenkoae]|uniref:CHASE2 domain-containing protein n=1 Tax=Sodalinema gerasimenkoae TaxID=2862348 RepID=UPI001357BF26|nr:CHASE2 domain-containing protein [Sodalinema gerasimenkoae]
MTKLVTLRLTGNLEKGGFQVYLEISTDGDHPSIEEGGQLPAAPELLTQLETHWLGNYRPLSAPYRIKSKGIEYSGSIQTRVKACLESGQTLRDRLNQWLDAESFRDIDRLLRQQLEPAEDIRVLIRTNDSRLHKLPWHLWSFCQSYPNTEIALSPPKFQRRERFSSQGGRQKIRILAILGHAEGIKVNPDREILKNLPDAEVKFVDEPTRSEINDQLWDQPWDIIFFAGHSETEGDEGRIHINPTESLTIDELWYALRKAVNQGLQVAIFNSCDGLGLARRLDDLQIPITIVMRELIPDEVAHKFLAHFLSGFADGKPFYRAVREARERLQGMENEFPCASWLPVVCQHPWEDPPTWQGLLTPLTPRPSKTSPWWKGLGTVLVASMLVTSLVMGGRSLGWLEQSELNAYDHLMRSRPAETMDERLLLVEITKDDVQSQPVSERGEDSLSDQALEQLLEILERHEPSVIGLQVFLGGRTHGEKLTQIIQDHHFFMACVYGDSEPEGTWISTDISTQKLGFTDVLADKDSIIRRHLFALTNEPPNCPTSLSLGFFMAEEYLNQRGLSLEYSKDDDYHRLGNLSFSILGHNSGGYHQVNANGLQLMLNYRNVEQVAHTLTLNKILSDRFDPNLVRGKIVLIGTTDPEFKDTNYLTALKYRNKKFSGLELQAHMISQILSATLDNRPLIWWWPQPIETFWILLWSFIGGVMAWHSRSPVKLALATAIALALLFGICWALFLQGGWIPLIPAALAIVLTAVTLKMIFSNPDIQNNF